MPLDASMLRITEFLASNDEGLLDADGDASDWLEIYNSGGDAVDLSGMHLTDNAGELDQMDVPRRDDAGIRAGTASCSPRTRTACSPAASCTPTSRSPPTASIWHSSPPTASRSSTQYDPKFPEAGRGRFLRPRDGAHRRLDDAPRQRRTGRALGSHQQRVRHDVAERRLQRRACSTIAGPDGVRLREQPGRRRSTTRRRSATTVPEHDAVAVHARDVQSDYARRHRRLTLRMRYDDGFVAYINGEYIAEANAPETLQWNSVAAGLARRRAGRAVLDFDASARDLQASASAKTCWRSMR